MFKNNIKIAVIGLFVALSLVPAELCSMNYLEVVNSRSPSVAKQSQALRSRFSTFVGRSFDKSKFFVREHPILTLGALGLVSLGVVGYYSGLFSGSGDKTEKTKKAQVPVCKKGEDVTNQWKIKLAILYSLQTVTAFGSNVFTELARVFYKMTESVEKKAEKIVEEKIVEEKIEEKKVEKTPDEKAKADLKQLIATYAPKEEPKLKVHKKSLAAYKTSTLRPGYEWSARDSEEDYIKYILFNLKEYESDKEQLKLFVNQIMWADDMSREENWHPFPTDVKEYGQAGSFSLFTTLFLYGYLDALNLLLSTDQLDFKATYGPLDSRCECCNPGTETVSSLGYHLFLNGSNRRHPENKGVDEKAIINVLWSHGATPLFMASKKFKDTAEKWHNWSLDPKSFKLPKGKNLYFSSDGTKVITASEFVKQLKKRLDSFK
ncbi:MAG: hypothetical protein UV38_C0003G0227 [candidate division TM6 bacterium GW2011_GWE2_42_60]|nr:MAG: hypothetical protein UV38_C0003G0227 [candidate division TM6 bacterium GW2011_GWE2_42_60]HBY05845.1 hypothetical protein [Candidatus Dependentiae bacterium]